ncbi:MAG: hypothetical protein Q8M98_04945 [Candidatus Cloacimonadaceae bacterium]|nr:hypothetical protein [Candidatus Cloacimonadaceae bacterium]MDP3114108.1 hypothetical protein [Candidatus Cloacimonadaceae bacterium]
MIKSTFATLVREFNFKELFNQMGWDNATGSFETDLKGTIYTVSVICEKSGFRFLQCSPPVGSSIPPKNDRLRIQSIVKRRYYEHLLIFIDETKQRQVWQYAYKPAGKPLKTVITEYYITQDPQLLYQRTAGLVFSIDEHENITLVDVTKRLNATIDQNSEKVTKKFYDGFKKQHTKFLSFMTGITEEIDRNWYASVMLNRLMFCYFIQKRGFLDNNVHYLMNKLQDGQRVRGRDQFYSFYRNFLLHLFHEGLGSPDRGRFSSEIGKIPYLNGGIFSVHELETKYEGQIKITDEAFESLFKFFEEYHWHLDTNVTATGRDVNPDVIGYIFEKYINDRAQMGAYYTKEDITDYIGKNTILPYLFDEVQRKYPDAFKPVGEIWQKLMSSEDQFIYNAVKHGINPDDVWHDLPDDIKAGLDPEQINLVEIRRCWNRPAPSDAALPTEIWREVITRRQRYIEVKKLLSSGNITQINDFITYNLDIRQFALDLIYETDDPKLVFQFYNALKSITILDPTCGSGAFLFAAMNILEDLYEACINRMKDFVHDNHGHGTSHLKRELDIVDTPSHPNLEYFIYKSIILNNLYGVDIMNEAVEIAKLRLFLKLVACVDPDPKHPNYGLEPLPDIDFNIRCGNTLVGYANWEEIEKDIESDAISAAENKEIIPEMCQKVAMAFIQYKDIQLEGYQDYKNFVVAKSELQDNLKELTSHLDKMLYQHSNSVSYSKWKEAHQPFHWFAEFYEIIHDNEGFGVIIGNPPYIETTKVSYTLDNYKTCPCGNLYALVIERVHTISNKTSSISMIVQLPIVCTDRMIPLQEMLVDRHTCWFSTFDDRPGKLFDDLQHIRATIIISKCMQPSQIFTSKYNRWVSSTRENLFKNLYYFETEPKLYRGAIAKIGGKSFLTIVQKLLLMKGRFTSCITDFKVLYHNAPQYWVRALDFSPYFSSEKLGISVSTQVKSLTARSEIEKIFLIAVVNSSLFYVWFIGFSDCRHLNLREITSFPYDIESVSSEISEKLAISVSHLMDSYNAHKSRVVANYKTSGRVEYDEFYPRLSKETIDEIDNILSVYYNFTPEELDFIINFDIKYRMGSSLNERDDDDFQDSGQ